MRQARSAAKRIGPRRSAEGLFPYLPAETIGSAPSSSAEFILASIVGKFSVGSWVYHGRGAKKPLYLPLSF